MQDMSSTNARDVVLRRNQKLDALGRIAYGVAHDFNNLLTVIEGYSQLVLKTGANSPFESIQQSVEQISRAASRAAELTSELCALSRRRPLNSCPIIVRNLVSELEPDLLRLAGEDIDLVIRMGTDLCAVKIDSNDLRRMILNLAANACEAMPQGGTLTIGVGLQEQLPYGLSDSENTGPYVVVSVLDTGIGMDESVMSRLFEPYFTTKYNGRQGMGLANVYGTVRNIGGEVIVESELGRGSRFQVYLPKADEEVEAEGVRTILVVEDEVSVRTFIAKELRALSYRVLEASDAVEAFSLSGSRRGAIDLLLTDIVLPAFTGLELAEKMVQSRPGIKILFISGYAEVPDSVEANSVLETAGARFLRKPFSAGELAESVDQLLGDS